MKLLFLTLIFVLSASIFSQELKYESNSGDSDALYDYILYIPLDVSNTKPLILFLHGAGERGDQLEFVKTNGPLKYLQENNIDAYVLAPQCPANLYWESDKLIKLIYNVINANSIDRSAIHYTGLSMGAWGIWNLAIQHPEIPASIVPIAGFVDRIPMIEICKLKDIPIRLFHGLKDDVVDVFYSKEIYRRAKKCSENIDLILFEDAGHDSWSRVYDNIDIYEWMLTQVRKDKR
jgi:predicted peptidase